MENIELPKKLEAKVGKEGAVFLSEGKWYVASYVSEPKDSMVEAINLAMNGGISIYEMTYMFKRHGTSIGECFEQDPGAVIDFLQKKFEKELGYLSKKQEVDTEGYKKLCDSLINIRDNQVLSGQDELSNVISEMIAKCESLVK